MAQSKYTPQQGRYLISEPFLADPNFKRTVVLLTEHNDEGSVGFVLNRPTEMVISDVIPDLKLNAPLYVGGPVQQDSVHFIHKVPELKEDSVEIAKGLFWGGGFDKLQFLASTGQIDDGDIKFFLGYSGWAANQLDMEMEQLSWIVAPANGKFAFTEDDGNLWRMILQSMGTKFKIISNYPEDPSYN